MIDKNLWRQGLQHKSQLVASILAGVACGGAIVWQAYLLADIVNQVFMEKQSLSMVWSTMVLLLAAMTLRAVLSWVEEGFALRLAAQVQQDIRNQMINKIQRLGPVAMNDEQTGQLITMMQEGVEAIEGYFSQYLPQLFKSAMIPILFLLFIFPVDWVSAVILLATAPLVPFFMMLIGKWTDNVNRKQWAVLNRLSGYLHDVLEGLVTLKMLNRSEQQGDKIERISETYRVTTMGVLRWAFLSALTLELLTTLSIAVVSVGLGVRLVEGVLQFKSAFFLLLLAPEFYLPLRSLGGYFHTSLNGISAAAHIYQFLALPEGAITSVADSTDFAGIDEVVFDHVSFAYPNSDGEAVSEISFTIRQHEKVAIVGPSGGGKTTIINLLLGFIKPSGGEILINGKPYDQINHQVLRQRIGMIPQKPYLFSGSILENILLGQGADDAVKAQQIAQQIGLKRLLDDHTQGLDLAVGQQGQSLSGGQRQLVAMARALVKESDLIIMDEATANLDLVTEQQVQQAVPILLKGKMGLIVAHRLSTIEQMDKILVVDHGRIVQMGHHQQLLQAEGLYRQMVERGRSDGAYTY